MRQNTRQPATVARFHHYFMQTAERDWHLATALPTKIISADSHPCHKWALSPSSCGSRLPRIVVAFERFLWTADADPRRFAPNQSYSAGWSGDDCYCFRHRQDSLIDWDLSEGVGQQWRRGMTAVPAKYRHLKTAAKRLPSECVADLCWRCGRMRCCQSCCCC